MGIEAEKLFGRRDMLSRIGDASAEARELVELVGSSGSGKTALIREVGHAGGSLKPIKIDLEGYDPGHPNLVTTTPSVGAVQASFQQYKALLIRLMAEARTEAVAREFAEVANASYQSEVAGRRSFGLELAMQEIQRRIGTSDLVEAWLDSKDRLTDAFLTRWNEPGDEGRGRLLIFDNADEVATQELGRWLGELLVRLEHTAVVVTRQGEERAGLAPAVEGDRRTTLAVAPFDKEQVQRFLRDSEAQVSPNMAEVVQEITGGLPGTVVILRDLLWKRQLHTTLDVEDLLAEAREAKGTQVALLVRRLVLAQQDPLQDDYGRLLWRVVQAAAVPREFDATLLYRLLDDQDRERIDQDEMILRVKDLPFVEALERPSRLPGTEDFEISRDTHFRIHRHVRDQLLAQMVKLDAERFSRTHGRAVGFYADRLVGEEAVDLGYGEGFVYEKPGWQGNKREWLHHRAQSSDDRERRDTIVESALVFLEAFWWWGNFVHFDFCDQVVSDLGQMLARPIDTEARASWGDLRRLHAALEGLLEHYPPRSTKTDADWGLIRGHLLEIEHVCGLRRSSACVTARDHKVRALLDIFFAHSYRYVDADDPKADQYYARAERHLGRAAALAGSGTEESDAEADGEQDEEDWNLPWVRFERAELCSQQSEPDAEKLEALWHAAAAGAQPPPRETEQTGEVDPLDDLDALDDLDDGPDQEIDEELIANLHRLRGDLCVKAGDPARAATWYRRALLHGYLSHEVKTYADEYTLQHYVDLRARALTHIRDLILAGDHDAALAFALEVAAVRYEDTVARRPDPEQWRSELAASLALDAPELDLVGLAEHLFLAGPKVEDLGTDQGEFHPAFNAIHNNVDHRAIRHDLYDDSAWP